jgi:hypothetical protein
MRKTTNSVIVLAIELLTSGFVQAQGTIYMSNLGQPSSGVATVGNNSWAAVNFLTGNNAGGYSLNSVQLAMIGATGSPNGFTVMIYHEANNPAAILPGSSLDTLSGPSNPSTDGTYTYTASSLTLVPSTYYFIVLTSGTAISNGAYELNEGASYATSSDGGGGGLIFSSSDGSNWRGKPFTYAQFGITAAAVPEPSSAFLFLLGSGVLMYVRRIFHR